MVVQSRWRLRLAAALAAVVALAVLGRPLWARAELPARLSDQDFWALSDQLSEPDGYFQSDNLVGNERMLQYVIPSLKKMKRGGVYLGVAPDQNFTYISALEPKMAFIVDIRRGNLRAHLMYKALFEMSADRVDFVSLLFSRKRPAGLGPQASAADIMNAIFEVKGDDELYKSNLKAITDLLVKKHGFALSPDDLAGLEYVYHAFYWFGPQITYQSSNQNGNGRGNMPNYADLQMLTDDQGQPRGYLASEDNFKIIKSLEEKNLLVPVVGDFAGPKALRGVGKDLADHGAVVTAFYTSNVEQYLFQNGVWTGFYQNVSTLPLDEASTFIRSARSTNVLDPIKLLLKDFADGRIRAYQDVTARGGR